MPSIVRDWMTSTPRCVPPSTKLPDAYAMMTMNEIHHLPVVDEGRLVGLVSDRDLVIALHFHDSRHMTVAQIMTAAPSTTADASIRALAEAMVKRHQIASVVLDGDHVVGIFTAIDALRALASGTPAPR